MGDSDSAISTHSSAFIIFSVLINLVGAQQLLVDHRQVALFLSFSFLTLNMSELPLKCVLLCPLRNIRRALLDQMRGPFVQQQQQCSTPTGANHVPMGIQ